jgi:hypothetical protein
MGEKKFIHIENRNNFILKAKNNILCVEVHSKNKSRHKSIQIQTNSSLDDITNHIPKFNKKWTQYILIFKFVIFSIDLHHMRFFCSPPIYTL